MFIRNNYCEESIYFTKIDAYSGSPLALKINKFHTYLWLGIFFHCSAGKFIINMISGLYRYKDIKLTRLLNM